MIFYTLPYVMKIYELKGILIKVDIAVQNADWLTTTKAAFSKRYRLADVRTSGNLCLHSRFPDVFSALPIGPIAKTGGAGGMA